MLKNELSGENNITIFFFFREVMELRRPGKDWKEIFEDEYRLSNFV